MPPNPKCRCSPPVEARKSKSKLVKQRPRSNLVTPLVVVDAAALTGVGEALSAPDLTRDVIHHHRALVLDVESSCLHAATEC